MEIELNWVLFLLTAAGYVLYPLWRLPLPWPAQWALLNILIALSIFALKGPLSGCRLTLRTGLFKELWLAILAAAALALPFWTLGLPVGGDDQSHAGPAAFLLGRAAALAGFNQAWLPLVVLPAAGLILLLRRRLPSIGENAAAVLLAAAGNIYFFADRAWGTAAAIGNLETLMRYPPLDKFLYLGSYLALGINEAGPRIVQFAFVSLAAVYLFKLLRQAGGGASPRLTYLLAVLFPTFFNLSISAELEGGTLFFFTASIYYFIRAYREESRDSFLKAAFLVSAGMLYKQLVLGLLLAAAPALALLWLAVRQKRSFYASCLKFLMVPAAAGFPFLLISALFARESTGFVLGNIFKPAVMLAPFGNFYHTLGPWLTILAAGATVYAVAGRRGPETLGVLYFSFVYYLLINLTGAAGFIRHAQPSYIAPVFYTLLLADTAYAAAGRKAALLGAAALTGIFAWYAAFDPAPFQRRTIANYTDHIFPYEQAVDYIRALGGRQKIYAPMEVEPSHFYLAKAGLAGKIDWDRTLPPDLSAEKAAGACAAMACDYILLPYSSFVGVDTDFTRIADGLTAAGAFRTEKVFDYHGNRLILLKKNVRNTR